jgi:hypothetical protein
MSKEEMIKQVVLQVIDAGDKGAYTAMKKAGFGQGEDMAIFWRIYDSLHPVDAK